MITIRRIALFFALLLMYAALPACAIHAQAEESIVITAQPQSVVAVDSETASVSIEAAGAGLSYQWYYKGGKDAAFTPSDVTVPTYSVTMSKEVSGQQVYCAVTDAAGNMVRSKIAALNSANGPEFAITPEDMCVTPGQSAQIPCKVWGSNMEYTWYQHHWENEYEFYRSSSSTLVGSKYLYQTAGSVEYYYCVVTDYYGYSVTTEVVKITTNEPHILSSSEKDNYVTAGDTITLFVEAEGDDLTYWWSCSYSHDAYMPDWDTRRSPSITLTMSTEMNGMYLYCEIKDSHGNELETHDMHLWLPVLEITEQPENLEIVTGMEAKTSITAIGEDLRYRWYISYEDEEYTALPLIDPEFTVTLTKTGDYRFYCEVMDKSERSRKSYERYITVYDPVYIERDLEDYKGRDGTNIQPSFLVKGCGVTYQWYEKALGSSSFTLSDNTAYYYSMTINGVTNGRQVYCVATDIAGNAVTSSVITLKLDTSLMIRGNCGICGGDGDCNRCGGDGEYRKLIFNGVSHEYYDVECDAEVCADGDCTNCSNGWVGRKKVAGDADENGVTNKYDVLRVLQHAAGWDVTVEECGADTSCDSKIDAYDALLILRYLADPEN